MTIHFAMTASQRAQMRRLLADQQTRGGSLYHHWLTPEAYADRFGLTASDVQSITLWLKGAGFSQVEAARSRTSVSFSGTAAQTEAAFQTSIHRYVSNGAHFANVSDPVLPKALEGIVEGIRGLNDFHPKPHLVRPRPGGVEAHFTSSISGNHFLAPDDSVVELLRLLGVARIAGSHILVTTDENKFNPCVRKVLRHGVARFLINPKPLLGDYDRSQNTL